MTSGGDPVGLLVPLGQVLALGLDFCIAVAISGFARPILGTLVLLVWLPSESFELAYSVNSGA